MRKFFTKIICFAAAVIVALGLLLVSACSDVYKAKPLTGNVFAGEVTSNGGFAVEKGDYVYFINGREANTADNTFGSPVKGAIMRISKTDLAARNYSSVDTVVPLVIYTGNTKAGIYIYGDYIYYSTPSTEKNSNGEVLSDRLTFNRTKLDGTDTNKDYFIQHSTNSLEYRYVEVDGVVYLVYVATSETLYGESTGCTNLHSLNTQTGVNTLLAYNVSAVTFDSKDVTNPQIYYTMKVPDFVSGATSTFSSYNQIYTVRADATTPNAYDFTGVDGYNASTNPLYVNCGKLVFDGIGKVEGITNSVTQFNGAGANAVERSAYTYTVSDYENGTLFYTRTSTYDDTSFLFSAKQSELLAQGWNSVTGNPDNTSCLSDDGSAASNYNYVFKANGDIDFVLIADATGLVKAKVVEGKIAKDLDDTNRYYITDDGQATVLFTAKHGDKNYIYYSLKGGNGYTVHRVCYDGNNNDYPVNVMPVTQNAEYTPVQVLDLDAASDWYKPELLENQLLFPSQTENMTAYTYIMACDLRNKEGSGVMTNAEIDALTESYNGIEEAIAETDETVYENLQNALRYGFYTNDATYLNTLIKAFVDVKGYDEERFWSKESVEKYAAFIAAGSEGEWKNYSATKKVNGVDVAANKRDYYYSVLGKMNEADAESYSDLLKTTYLQDYPEKESKGFASWSKGAKAGLIIGVVLGGLAIIAVVVVVTLVVIRKKKSKLPTYKKKRIKVDTTDDKNIDVYSDGESKKPEDTADE